MNETWIQVSDYLLRASVFCMPEKTYTFPKSVRSAASWATACQAYNAAVESALPGLLQNAVLPDAVNVRFFAWARLLAAHMFAQRVSVMPELIRDPPGVAPERVVDWLVLDYWHRIGMQDVRARIKDGGRDPH